MAPQKLPDGSHIARHCGHQKVHFQKGVVFPEAFALQEKDDGYLSASWLEFFAGDETERLRATANSMRQAGRKLGPNSALTLLSADRVRTSARELHNTPLRTLHEPEPLPGNPAYAVVRGYREGASERFLHDVFCLNCVSVTRVGDL